jgi:molecular chaperone DnaK
VALAAAPRPKPATTSLTDALQAFGQKLYEAAARDTDAAGTSASGQDGASSDEEIIDAEIVDDKCAATHP